MAGKYAVYAVQLISLMVLARQFSPSLFGVVASVQVFFVFFQLFSEAGIGPALINVKNLAPQDRDGLFSLTLLFGTVISLIFILLASAFESFYHISRVNEVVPYLAGSIFFYTAAIVPTAALLHDRKFLKVSQAGLIAEAGSLVGVLVLRKLIDPLHALAAKSFIFSILQFFSCFWFSRNTIFGLPAPGSRLSAINSIISFSLYQFGFNIINYFSRNLDNILVGRQLGASSLASYDKAYQLMRYPLMLLTFAMTPAIQPVINKHIEDKKMIERLHRDFTFKLAVIGLIVGAIIVFFSREIVTLLLGPQWNSVTPIIHILAFSIPVQVVLSTSGSFFQGMNRADLLFKAGGGTAVIIVTAIVVGALCRDLIVLSWGLVIAYYITFFLVYYILYKMVFEVRCTTFFKKMLWPVSGSLLLMFTAIR